MQKLKRTILQFLLFTVAVFLIATHLPGLYMSDLSAAVAFTLVVSIFNFMLWPLLSTWLQSFLVITFGVGSFLLSAFVMWLTSMFIPGVSISPLTFISAPLVVAIFTGLITLGVNIDDDDVYARQVHSQLKRRMKKAKKSNKPGFVFLEIDGLSEEVLRTAIDHGRMPTLAGWLREGTHKIIGWETDLSSQTSSSQAGILHGCNKDIPAFRWVDKYNDNQIVSSNGINDAPLIQERISNGTGLLSVNGGSVANLFSGDSKDNVLVYSTLKNIRQLWSESWGAFFSRPYNVGQVLVLFLGELLFESRSRIRQWRKNIQPRLKHRGLTYYFARAGANVLLREVSTYTVIGDIIAADKDVVYTTFFGYDEVAHHCGVRDEESYNVLKGIDARISRIAAATQHSSRPYQICVLSDHGQTNGATFKQRYGVDLGEYVKRFLPKDESIYEELDSNQDHFFQMISEPCSGIKCKLTRGAKAKRVRKAGVIVLASGNLGLIYFKRYGRRLTWEEINVMCPGLVENLVNHEGIGFALLRSQSHGPVILNAKGKYFLADDTVEGENPLAKFGRNAATHLRRTDSFNYVPDILVMSLYDSDKDEVASFEELIGSHGGLGGDQSKPFIMYPAEWKLSDQEIVGSEEVYKVFKASIENEQKKCIASTLELKSRE